MAEPKLQGALGDQHDCQFTSDPRRNKSLVAQLQGCHVLIAGAGRGIGRATAEFFACARVKSLSLMALELDEVDETARLCKTINPSILTKTGAFDVRDYDKVQEFVDQVHREFGRLDVLFMNAGRPPQWLALHESDPGVWWDTVAISLQGSFNFSRAVLPLMRKQNGGRIIFTASAGAHVDMGMSSYTVGKLGVVRLSEIVHQENKAFNIRCFSIHPGSVRTRFFTDFQDVVDGKTKPNSYVPSTTESDNKSAQVVVRLFGDSKFDTPQMPVGLVLVLASGNMDFMSGRYVDATRKVDDYLAEEDQIIARDLHRVKLVADVDLLLPSHLKDQ